MGANSITPVAKRVWHAAQSPRFPGEAFAHDAGPERPREVDEPAPLDHGKIASDKTN